MAEDKESTMESFDSTVTKSVPSNEGGAEAQVNDVSTVTDDGSSATGNHVTIQSRNIPGGESELKSTVDEQEYHPMVEHKPVGPFEKKFMDKLGKQFGRMKSLDDGTKQSAMLQQKKAATRRLLEKSMQRNNTINRNQEISTNSNDNEEGEEHHIESDSYGCGEDHSTRNINSFIQGEKVPNTVHKVHHADKAGKGVAIYGYHLSNDDEQMYCSTEQSASQDSRDGDTNFIGCVGVVLDGHQIIPINIATQQGLLTRLSENSGESIGPRTTENYVRDEESGSEIDDAEQFRRPSEITINEDKAEDDQSEEQHRRRKRRALCVPFLIIAVLAVIVGPLLLSRSRGATNASKNTLQGGGLRSATTSPSVIDLIRPNGYSLTSSPPSTVFSGVSYLCAD